MGEKYWITGVQLGLLISEEVSQVEKNKIMSELIGSQFIGRYDTDAEQQVFLQEIRKLSAKTQRH